MSGEATFTILLAKRDFSFSCAHFLVFDSENAELLHGHNYRVEVELRGKSPNEEGLLIDIGRTKGLIRAACASLDCHTLVPSLSRHLAVEQHGKSVEIAFHGRSYRLPTEDVLLLDQINTSIEILARMLWRELVSGLDEPSVEELGVGVSQTSGQTCWYRRSIGSTAG